MTDDHDEQKELLQEALVELWLTDPTRFDLRDDGERRYLRRRLVNKMWNVWNAQRAFERMHCRLEANELQATEEGMT